MARVRQEILEDGTTVYVPDPEGSYVVEFRPELHAEDP